MATDAFDQGIITRVERALALRDELQAEQVRLRACGDTREYESSSNRQDRDDPMVWVEWRLRNSPPSPSLAMAALLGDCIQNLRVSLEYAAWAAASEQARQTRPTQIEFPLLDTEDGFRTWSDRRTGWFSEDVLRVLEWAQPYQAAADQLHPLRILRVLSNADKHRLLNVIDHAHIDVALDLDPMPPTHEWWTARGPVAAGELLARLSFPRPPHELTIDVRPTFGWYESVAYTPPAEPVRWLRLDEMMNAVCEFTVRTVGYMSGARQRQGEGSGHEPTPPSTDPG